MAYRPLFGSVIVKTRIFLLAIGFHFTDSQKPLPKERFDMKVEQNRWTVAKGWEHALPGKLSESAHLVFLFGSTPLLRGADRYPEVKKAYPGAILFGCTTSGEICDTQVSDDSLVITAVTFQSTMVRGAQVSLRETEGGLQAGKHLAGLLDKDELVHVLVLSDGLAINGSELVQGLAAGLPEGVSVTGGLSGDGDRFQETLVLLDGAPESGMVGILGLYGDRLRVGYGSMGGWDPFGPERLITRSEGNILYEFDGKSALDLYKTYLGDHAKGLPATGLLFPLCIRTQEGEPWLVRTILSINEDYQSMTFAGDVPEGAYARLMKANFDRLIDGAMGAAKVSRQGLGASSPDLALLISCVGRKMVLKQRIEEELEGVRDILGDRTALTGFYSYGEISPFSQGEKCSLHNQTMTVTTFLED